MSGINENENSDPPVPPNSPAGSDEGSDGVLPEATNPAPDAAGGSGGNKCPDQGHSGAREQVEPASDAADESTHNDDLTADSNDNNHPHDSAEDPEAKGMAMSYLDEVVPEADPKTEEEMGFKDSSD